MDVNIKNIEDASLKEWIERLRVADAIQAKDFSKLADQEPIMIVIDNRSNSTCLQYGPSDDTVSRACQDIWERYSGYDTGCSSGMGANYNFVFQYICDIADARIECLLMQIQSKRKRLENEVAEIESKIAKIKKQ